MAILTTILMNELIFIFHTFFIACCSLGAVYIGKEALIGFIALLAILSNLFVTKQIVLLEFQATPTDALTIGLVLSLNLLQEYYGKAMAKKAIIISFVLSLVYTLLSQIHLFYSPSIHDVTHYHAHVLFGFMPRIICASLFTYFVVQQFDCFLYELLKNRLSNKYLILRNYMSISVSQLLDTIIFSFLGLYGTVDSLLSIICVSYCIKLAVIGGATPFIWFSKKIYRVKEHETISL